MSAIDDLIQALEALKQKHDGTILYAAEVHDLVDGIFAAMEMAGNVTVATTPIEGGNRITITDPEGVVHEFDVMDGVDGADGNDGHNPCLGVFADQTALETAHPTAEVGDYAYAGVTDSTTQTTTSHIFRYSGSAWVDNGEGSPDNQPAFDGGTGPTVNATKIDDTQLANPAPNSLAKAVDVAAIRESLSEETEVEVAGPVTLGIDTASSTLTYRNSSQKCWYIPVTQGDVVKAEVTISEGKSVRWAFCENELTEGVSLVGVRTSVDDVTELEIVEVAPVTGYFVVNHATQGTTSTHKFYNVPMNLPDKIKDDLRKTGFYFSDDEDITPLVSSLPLRNMLIGANTGNWSSGSGRTHVLLDATGITSIVITPNSENSCDFAFLASYETPVDGVRPDYVGGTARISATEETEFRVPFGTKWICFNAVSNTANYMPSKVVVTGGAYVEYQQGFIPATNIIHYFEVDINTAVLTNGAGENASIESGNTTKSSFGVRFPSTYTPNGKPTRVLAMFHGNNGYVSGNAQTGVGSVLGYTNSSGWVTFQDELVNAGYIVFDVNGYGIYGVDSNSSHHWGCPGAVLTAKKAFEFLKENYNVYDKMLVFGFSMGGQLGLSYAMNFPSDVVAMALHEPAIATNRTYAELSNKNLSAVAFGYSDWAEAEADNFSNYIGYSIALSFTRYDNGVANFAGMASLNLSNSLPSGVELVGHISCPTRIWQGTVGDSIAVAVSENIVTALRIGGCNATVRLCPGISHAQLKQTQYVKDETLYFLNRYK